MIAVDGTPERPKPVPKSAPPQKEREASDFPLPEEALELLKNLKSSLPKQATYQK